MGNDALSRRAVLALSGGAVTSGCTTVPGLGQSERLPVLVSIEVHNDTDATHEYELRVQYAGNERRPLETLFRSKGAVRARDVEDVDDDWPKEPGRYVVGVSVDGGEWHTQDITDRLTQDERICYAQDVSIADGGDAVTFWTNVDAPCPEP